MGKLPDSIATHWGADGQANGWSNKAFAVFGLPCILAVTHLFSVCITLNDPKRKNIHKKPLTLTFWIVPIVSLVTSGFTYAAALGSDMDINLIISILVGVLFIILGNYMPKLQQNYTVGIKLPWTLNSTENWNRTHRLGGKLFIAGGVLIAVSGFLRSSDRKSAQPNPGFRKRGERGSLSAKQNLFPAGKLLMSSCRKKVTTRRRSSTFVPPSKSCICRDALRFEQTQKTPKRLFENLSERV